MYRRPNAPANVTRDRGRVHQGRPTPSINKVDGSLFYVFGRQQECRLWFVRHMRGAGAQMMAFRFLPYLVFHVQQLLGVEIVLVGLALPAPL